MESELLLVDPDGFATEYPQEAKDFAISAVEAVCEDGEVDFEDQIIKHPSFVGSKADCVYEALINFNNNIFKNVINYFTDYRAEFKLKLEISSVSVGAEAQTNYDETTGIITIVFPQAING
ncbi:hypothetical protein [uncultured Olleya sp.]|uniref:hypothetical protein n=1 Tax=uncultured Olleya sp. TaxID=757243 RepID=UPI002595457C|nr:hypothetical protein [uncultured Olleya sp.]